MQKAETVQWQKLRGMLESSLGVVALPTGVAVAVIVLLEKLITKKSVLERKIGISLNLRDHSFYSQERSNAGGRKELEAQTRDYLEVRNAFSGRFSLDELPAEITESFSALTTEIEQMMQRSEFRQAIKVAFAWIESVKNTSEGKKSIYKSYPDGSSISGDTWTIFDSEILKMVSQIYEQIAKSNLILKDPRYFYLEAAQYGMRASKGNMLDADLNDDKRIIELLERAGYADQAQYIADLVID
jgi:hypothetical protein